MLQHGHYNPATTNLLRRVTTIRPLQTRHNPATTISPQPPGHYKFATTMVTTNSLQRWSLQIATIWSLQPRHNLASTILPQPRSLRIHYNPVATNSLQYFHYNPTTITWPLQSRHNPVTMLQPGHYKLANLVTTAQSLCWLQIPCSKRTILSTQCLLTPLAALLHCCLSISNVFVAQNIWENRVNWHAGVPPCNGYAIPINVL